MLFSSYLAVIFHIRRIVVYVFQIKCLPSTTNNGKQISVLILIGSSVFDNINSWVKTV